MSARVALLCDEDDRGCMALGMSMKDVSSQGRGLLLRARSNQQEAVLHKPEKILVLLLLIASCLEKIAVILACIASS